MIFHNGCTHEFSSRLPTLEELANIGHFLAGLAAFIGVIWFGSAWSHHQKIKRSQAATLVLSKFRRCIRDITDIGLKAHGYQYLSFKQPIRGEKDEKYYPERPPRLIESKIDQLNRELDEAVVSISGSASKKILDLLFELEKYSWHLCPAIYADLNDNTEWKKLPHTRAVLSEFPEKLNKMLAEMETILTPIIEFGDQGT